LIVGVIANSMVPSFFAVGGPLKALMVVSYFMLVPGVTVWIWSAVLVLIKIPKKQLITTGPYSIVKHPLYTNMAFFVLPWFGFLLNTWLGVLIGIVIYAGSKLFSREEETQLARIFGEGWYKYCATVRIPWL
jgi:protein-S-isoprenylcysteine O-methyltransferase Ste14